MALWYPAAIRDPIRDGTRVIDGGAFFEGMPFRGVLHTTEGTSYAGAKAAYRTHKSPPHFTGGLEAGQFVVRQHIPLDRAGRALENPPGGVETNRARAIQIEVVAFASNPHWPIELQVGLRDLMVWIEAQTGIRPWAPPFGNASSYGTRSATRMAGRDWYRFDGWCGHQHVPENKHWDPGAINAVMAALLARFPKEADVADAIRINHPPRLILVRPQGDGYWIVAYDGGVFAFGSAPPLGGIGGDPVERIIAGDVWPDGEGLLLMGEDGGVFALGSARYIERVHYP